MSPVGQEGDQTARLPQQQIEPEDFWGKFRAWSAPVAAALLALVLSRSVPFVGALLWGLLAGAIVANLVPVRNLDSWAKAAKVMLRWGIVFLGLQLSLASLADLGVGGVVIIVLTVGSTFLSTQWLGRRMGLEGPFVTLVSAGFAICGAAAVAAIQETVGATERQVARAVALVTIFGTAMIFFVPWAAGVIKLPTENAAVWAGASIHEVAQVVAASSLIGASAYPVASVVKLGRVVLLAPVTAAVGARNRGERPDTPVVPWFVGGFVIAAFIGSADVLPSPIVAGSALVATTFLAAGMFGLGLGLRVRDLIAIPLRGLLLASAATLVALTVPLALILLLL